METNTKAIFGVNGPSLLDDDSIKELEYFEFFPVDSNTSLNRPGNINIVIQQQDLITLPSEACLYFEGELAKQLGEFTDDDILMYLELTML